jgi:hypothetical protein
MPIVPFSGDFLNMIAEGRLGGDKEKGIPDESLPFLRISFFAGLAVKTALSVFLSHRQNILYVKQR